MNFLSGYKTIAAAIGLLGLGLTQLSQGNIEGGVTSILGSLAAFGLRTAVAKAGPVPPTAAGFTGSFLDDSSNTVTVRNGLAVDASKPGPPTTR